MVAQLWGVKNMDEQTIQDKIKTTFMNAVSGSSKFSEDEINGIVTTISSWLRAY